VRRRGGLACSFRKRAHVIVMALRGVVGIFFFVRCNAYSAVPEPRRPRSVSTMVTRTLRVPKIYARYDGHEMFLNSECICGQRHRVLMRGAYMSQPK